MSKIWTISCDNSETVRDQLIDHLFRLVPTSMTLNDLERRNRPYFAFFFPPNSIALQADYVTVVDDRPILSIKYCVPVAVFHFCPKLTHRAARSLFLFQIIFAPTSQNHQSIIPRQFLGSTFTTCTFIFKCDSITSIRNMCKVRLSFHLVTSIECAAYTSKI